MIKAEMLLTILCEECAEGWKLTRIGNPGEGQMKITCMFCNNQTVVSEAIGQAVGDAPVCAICPHCVEDSRRKEAFDRLSPEQIAKIGQVGETLKERSELLKNAPKYYLELTAFAIYTLAQIEAVLDARKPRHPVFDRSVILDEVIVEMTDNAVDVAKFVGCPLETVHEWAKHLTVYRF